MVSSNAFMARVGGMGMHYPSEVPGLEWSAIRAGIMEIADFNASNSLKSNFPAIALITPSVTALSIRRVTGEYPQERIVIRIDNMCENA